MMNNKDITVKSSLKLIKEKNFKQSYIRKSIIEKIKRFIVQRKFDGFKNVIYIWWI